MKRQGQHPIRGIVNVLGIILLALFLLPRTASADENSAYVNATIATSRGSFAVKYVRINLDNPNLRVYSLTGTSGDCDQCITKPLEQYINDVNGFAGIHGSYFCPADYAGCSGSEGSYYWLWFNTLTNLFTNASQNQFNIQGSLLAIDSENRTYPYRRAPEWTTRPDFERDENATLQALFSNGPGLIFNGENVTEMFSLDDKQRTVRGARGGFGLKDRNAYLVIASGATVIDLGAIMEVMGMDYAVNLDGGGTSALWYNGYKVGPGRNMPNAIVFAETGAALPAAAPGSGFFAYDPALRGGFDIAGGNTNGDGRDEIVMGTGPGQGPQVQILRSNGTVLKQFFAFESDHRNGVRIVTCDTNGDGRSEIVAAEGPGQLPRVRLYSPGGSLISSFLALDGQFRGGLNLGCGDTNGDAQREIMVAASTGGGPHIMVYRQNGQPLVNFFAYDSGFRGGVSLTAIDMNGDGRDEIITGPQTGAPHIGIFQVVTGAVRKLSPGFYAFSPNARTGVDVAGADIDGDGRRELLVAAGPGDSPLVKAYNIAEELVDTFYAFAPTFLGGVNLSGGDTDGDGEEDVLVVPRSNGGPQVRIIPR